jgi:hypothetical protein
MSVASSAAQVEATFDGFSKGIQVSTQVVIVRAGAHPLQHKKGKDSEASAICLKV